MKILIVDDHVLSRKGTTSVLTKLDGLVESIEVDSIESALDALRNNLKIDLVLLDLGLPDANDLDGLTRITSQFPNTDIVILSASEDPNIIKKSIKKGAKGYILKSSEYDVIIRAIELVLAGGIFVPMAVFNNADEAIRQLPTLNKSGEKLTQRQRDVLQLLMRGKPNKSIGAELSMSENTVRVHVGAILKFLNVSNRTEAALEARRQGIE